MHAIHDCFRLLVVAMPFIYHAQSTSTQYIRLCQNQCKHHGKQCARMAALQRCAGLMRGMAVPLSSAFVDNAVFAIAGSQPTLEAAASDFALPKSAHSGAGRLLCRLWKAAVADRGPCTTHGFNPLH